MSSIWNQAFGVTPQALALHEKRGQVLATNITHADTPGYQARDIDFQAVMKSVQSDPHPDSQKSAFSLDQQLKYRIPTQPSVDGNTVEAQKEQAEYAENSMRYLANLRFMDGKIRKMMLAIQGAKG